MNCYRMVAGVLVMTLVCVPTIRAQQPKKLKISKLEAEVIKLTNKERQKVNLPPLKPNAILFDVARKHSANMIKQDKLAHLLDGKRILDRIKATKYHYLVVGENLAWDPNSPAVTMKDWMNSKTHRENILYKEFTEIGIGAITDKDGYTWYTQVFGTQRPPE